MLTSGDVIDIDLGPPQGREAGFRHPGVVVTAQRILEADPSVVQVVPLTSNVRGFASEVVLEPDGATGLSTRSVAQCQHVRAVSTGRTSGPALGNVGPVALAQIREVLGVLLDVPGAR